MPFAAGATGRWEWTPTCRIGPAIPGGCAEAGPHLGFAQLAGNAWNLGGDATTGSVSITVDRAGHLRLAAGLTSAPPCEKAWCIAPEANTWVRGFPSVLYGVDQCHAATSPPQQPDLRLPIRVDAIPPNLVGTTTYEVRPTDLTYTVAYDMWLHPSDTATPCQTTGTLEVMVWTDHSDTAGLPDTMRMANASIPYSVDGDASSGTDAWRVYASNIYPRGETAPWGGTVWLVLDDHLRVDRGTVSVDLSVAFAAVGGLLRDLYGWDDIGRTHWLDAITFGLEYGPADAEVHGDGPVDFSLQISKFCLGVGTSVTETRC